MYLSMDSRTYMALSKVGLWRISTNYTGCPQNKHLSISEDLHELVLGLKVSGLFRACMTATRYIIWLYGQGLGWQYQNWKAYWEIHDRSESRLLGQQLFDWRYRAALSIEAEHISPSECIQRSSNSSHYSTRNGGIEWSDKRVQGWAALYYMSYRTWQSSHSRQCTEPYFRKFKVEKSKLGVFSHNEDDWRYSNQRIELQ